MVSLLELSDEILLLIIQALGNYSRFRDLPRFTTVCKKLAPLTRVELARRASIVSDDDDENSAAARHVQFMHWLKKYPEVLHCLDHIDISWVNPQQYQASKDIVDLVARSNSLRKLSIKFTSCITLEGLKIFATNRAYFASVKELLLDSYGGQSIPADFLAKLCQLSRLETISCQNPVTACSMPEMFTSPTRYLSTETFNLQNLVHRSTTSHIDLLKLIVPRSPHLRSIDIALPGPGVRIGDTDAGFLDVSQLSHSFRPKEIEELLMPAKPTIQKLTITSMRHCPRNYNTVYVHPHEHDDTFVDFSTFANIRHLRISSYLVFGRSTSAAKKHRDQARDIWQSLPPHLEKLGINFEGHQGIFCSLKDIDNAFDPESWDQGISGFMTWWNNNVLQVLRNKKNTGWLQDILDRTHTELPNLRVIHLVECYSAEWGAWIRVEVSSIMKLTVPDGVYVEVAMMVPEASESSCIDLLRECGWGDETDATEQEDDILETLIEDDQVDEA